MKKYSIAGLMSGTSLDGLDIACCEFIKEDENWSYNIIKAETIAYSKEWKRRLANLETSSAFELAHMNIEYGEYLGKQTKNFLQKNSLRIDYVSSHGHTIFHQPQKRLTYQLGSGAAIAAASGIKTICDFRSNDIVLCGQGAPLVPIGDHLLFSEFDACVNLGGFANISLKKGDVMIAFDICPVNIIANEFAKEKGLDYDRGGELGKGGKINTELLRKSNDLEYYKIKPPKSLGKEWVLEQVFPLIESLSINTEDKLRTLYEHVATQISSSINNFKTNKVLFTGGGTHNVFLIELIKSKTSAEVIIPDKNSVDFKEALIFAFLGVLRLREEVNCLKSVTGAERDNIGGCIYLP